MTDGARESGEDQSARGFEDLVREETMLPATQGPLTPAQELQRVDSLEYRVRVTMDRLTELVEAQLPEAVDGLRADFENLRAELREALAEARAALADERYQLRSQIATTVGAANRWFVRTRDQLFERLDQVAGAAAAAQAQAEAAASAAVAAAVPLPVPEAAPPAEEPEVVTEIEWEAADFEEQVEAETIDVGADLEEEAGQARAHEDSEGPPLATTVVTMEAPEFEVLMEPLRGDLRELQAEVGAMGEAVMALRDDVAYLGSRIPSRPSARLTPTQINTIVAAVQSALPPPPAPRRTLSKAAPAKATSAKATSAKAAPAKATSAKATSAKATSAKATSAKRTSPKATSAKRTSARATSSKAAAPRRTAAKKAPPTKRTPPAKRTAPTTRASTKRTVPTTRAAAPKRTTATKRGVTTDRRRTRLG